MSRFKSPSPKPTSIVSTSPTISRLLGPERFKRLMDTDEKKKTIKTCRKYINSSGKVCYQGNPILKSTQNLFLILWQLLYLNVFKRFVCFKSWRLERFPWECFSSLLRTYTASFCTGCSIPCPRYVERTNSLWYGRTSCLTKKLEIQDTETNKE